MGVSQVKGQLGQLHGLSVSKIEMKEQGVVVRAFNCSRVLPAPQAEAGGFL